MPKMRTKRAAAKRFKVTGSGKIKRKQSHASHIFTKKSRKRKRFLRQSALIASADMSRAKKMIS